MQPVQNKNLSPWWVVLACAIVLVLWATWAAFGVRIVFNYVAPNSASAPVISPPAPNPASSASSALDKTASAAPTMSDLGQVGDLFGGINALFAALTVVGVAWAGYLQWRTLNDTQLALAHDRKSSSRLQFEGSFFQMLGLARDITARIDRGETYKGGAAALDSWALSVATNAKSPVHGPGATPIHALTVLAVTYDNRVRRKHPGSLGPYFRSLYQTFKLIDTAADDVLSADDKTWFANIARGQMSEGAVFLLAINGALPEGEKFAPYIDRYGLLEHMHRSYLGSFREAFNVVYSPTAFMGSTARAAHKRSLVPKTLMRETIDRARGEVAGVLHENFGLQEGFGDN